MITTIVATEKYIDPNLICYAHERNVRIIGIAVYPTEQLLNKTHVDEWVTTKFQFLKDNFLDGFNLDFEDPIDDKSPEQGALLSLVKHIRSLLDTEVSTYAQLTMDAPFAPGCTWGRCYGWKALSDYLDFIFIMYYDMGGESGPQWNCKAAPNSPYPTVVKGINEFLAKGIPANQLVLGAPWYGYDYGCDPLTNITSCSMCDSNGKHRQVAVTYARIMSLIPTSTTGVIYNDYFKSVYFNYKASDGTMHQVWFDNPKTLSIKYELAKNMGMRGIGMWQADDLDYNNQEQVSSVWNSMKVFS